jgi:acyl-CoA thioesterase YciA
VAMDSIKFHAPVFVGDLVSFYTTVRRVGRTSVTVQVDVVVERRDNPGEEVPVTEAVVTYVAIGDDGRPIPVLDVKSR